MSKILAACYYTFWVVISIAQVGATPSCEPFPNTTPIVIAAFLGIGMALAFLGGRDE
jgi:hypothetical protein